MGDTNLSPFPCSFAHHWLPYLSLEVHLMMEPFCVILKRALASEHPLYQILKYHCRDVTIPNSVGTPAIVGDGEFMDQLFAFGSNGTTRLLRDAYQIASWEVTDFRGEIKVRSWVVSNNTPCFGTWPRMHVPSPPPYLSVVRYCPNFGPLFMDFLDSPLIKLDGRDKIPEATFWTLCNLEISVFGSLYSNPLK